MIGKRYKTKGIKSAVTLLGAAAFLLLSAACAGAEGNGAALSQAERTAAQSAPDGQIGAAESAGQADPINPSVPADTAGQTAVDLSGPPADGAPSGAGAPPNGGPPEFTEDGNELKDGFMFIHNRVGVYLGENTARVLYELGPETEYYEYPSCAFDGDAKMYIYDGFELATYMLHKDDCDRVFSVTFHDDSVATAEGVCIGQDYEAMTAAYGTVYEEIPGCYIYERAGTYLSFTFEDGRIISISYYANEAN